MGHKNESKKHNADKSNPQSKDNPKFTNKQLAQSWPLQDQEVNKESSVKYLVEHWTAGKKTPKKQREKKELLGEEYLYVTV